MDRSRSRGRCSGGRAGEPSIPASGLVARYRADTGLTLVSGDVSSWAVKAGTLGAATQGTAANRLVSAGSATINGKRTVTMSTPGRWVVLPSLAALTSVEIFLVGKLAADPPDASFTGDTGGLWRVGTSALSTVVPFTDGIVYDDAGTTVRKTTANPAASMAAPFLYNVRSAANAWSNHLNGVQLHSTGTNTVGLATVPTLGANAATDGGAINGFGDGLLAEVLIYNAVLSAGDRATIHAYVTSYYAIAVS